MAELGGQDAKIVRFEAHAGGLRRIVAMNDKCAGGTGAVIDKTSAKLRIPADAVGALPAQVPRRVRATAGPRERRIQARLARYERRLRRAVMAAS